MSIRTRTVLGVAALAAAGILGAAGIVWSGAFSVSAREGHGKVFYDVMHYAFERSVETHATETAPPDLDDPALVALGAQHYDRICSSCHGGPGLGQSPQALAMTPRPQHLPDVVGQFSDAELHWIVQHGVKFSGMPAWPAADREDEVWALVSFLRRLPGMEAADYAEMVAAPEEDAPRMPYQVAAVQHEMHFFKTGPRMEDYAYAVPATAFGGETRTDAPTAMCSGCHGSDGSGTPTGGIAPNLTL